MKLKLSLLSDILNNVSSPNKYSKAFLALKNVIELELSENADNLSQDICHEFSKISELYENFINGVPLKVVERHYITNIENLNKYIYIEYKGDEIADYKVVDIFNELENFFEQVFKLTCQIADMYNLEIKLNNSNKKLDSV